MTYIFFNVGQSFKFIFSVSLQGKEGSTRKSMPFGLEEKSCVTPFRDCHQRVTIFFLEGNFILLQRFCRRWFLRPIKFNEDAFSSVCYPIRDKYFSAS